MMIGLLCLKSKSLLSKKSNNLSMNTLLLIGIVIIGVVGVYAYNVYVFIPQKYAEYDCPRNEIVKLPTGEIICANDVAVTDETDNGLIKYNITGVNQSG